MIKIRKRKKNNPYEETSDEYEIYSDEGREELLDNDEISAEEAAFMSGYMA